MEEAYAQPLTLWSVQGFPNVSVSLKLSLCAGSTVGKDTAWEKELKELWLRKGKRSHRGHIV